MPQPDDAFTVRVQPRASSSRIVCREGEIKAYVTAAPVDGEANEAVIALLAKTLKVAKQTITIRHGHQGRTKAMSVEGLSREQVFARLSQSQ